MSEAAAPRPAASPEPEVARSLAATRREAAWSALMGGLTEPFMIPYALALGATNFQAGLLSSVRNLLLSLVQLRAGAAVTWLGSRRRVVLWAVGVQAATWVPLAVVWPLFGAASVPMLIALYTVGSAAAAISGPAWGSLVSEYLPPDQRGDFFGRRAQAVGLWTTVAGFTAGGILHFAGAHAVVGFGLLCAAAAVTRTMAWREFALLHERPWMDQPHLRFSFWKFLRATPRSNFARFTLSMGGYSFATHLAAPYFAVYQLEELGYGYMTYTTIVLVASLTGMLTSPWWGRLGDDIGNWRVMRWSIVGASFLPACWTFFDHPLWLGGLNIVGAFLWGGLNLSATNLVYDAVTPAKRHTCLAYFNVVNGLGVSAGAFCGGLLMSAIGPGTGEGFAIVFYASMLARLAFALCFRLSVREVREVRQVGLRQVVLDLVGQRLVQVVGFFQRPEEERPRPRLRHAPDRPTRGIRRVRERLAGRRAG
jgi:MFS family permease